MKNIKETITKKVEELGCVLGCYDVNLDKVLTVSALNKVLENLDQEYTDVFLTIRNKLYIVEIATVDNEKDLKLFDGISYFNQYGNLEDALDNGSITEKQYNAIKNNL